MKTYAEHYKKCRASMGTPNQDSRYKSVYDLTLDSNFLPQDDEYQRIVDSVSKKVSKKIDNNEGCFHVPFATYLNEWRDIEELRDLANLFMPLIEREVFHCNAKIEFVMPYRNLACENSPEASWLWHYDDCPKEFIKLAICLNETTEDNGCLQYLVGPDGTTPVIPSFRDSPYRPVMRQVFAGSRIPREVMDRSVESGAIVNNLVGPCGTHALLTPNIPHRATIPKLGSTPRESIWFFIRPTIKKYDSYISEATYSILPQRNTKRYDLD